MKKSLLALIPLALMFAAIFTPMAFSGPTQPPVDTTTLYVGTIGWGPRDADPKLSYDTGSGQLIFNSYEQLIALGKDQTNEWGTWDVQEQYWEFEPRLATNVPDRQEVTSTFLNTSFVWTICVISELPYEPSWIFEPICTWWEDDLAQPFNSYHITDWIDSNMNGEIDFCDYIQMNDYWWEPEIPMEVQVKGCRWWHVVDVQYHEPDWKLVLEYVSSTSFDPLDPVSTWWTSEDYPGTYFHVTGWVDNNPLPPEGLEYCDVVYMMEYQWVEVIWEKIGPGWTLLPVTCRTWHVLSWEAGVLLHLHRWYYDFNIRTDPVVYFVNETGDIVDTFDIDDVEYSMERGFIIDSYYGPNWMLSLPTMDAMHLDDWDTGDPADWIYVSYLIDDAFEIVSYDPPVFRLNTGIDFPDNAFKQVLAQSWGAIMSRDFALSIGDWDGELFLDLNQDCFPDWYAEWWHMDERSVFETSWRYCGTGPYYVSLVDDVNDIVVLEANTHYWMGWPATDRKDYLDRIDIEYISAWATRRDAFIACQLDICAVPRAYMSELLDEWGEPKYPEIVTIKNIYPGLALDATHYTFDLNPESPYIGTGSFPNGIPSNFFNNTHVRKAFHHSFNRSKYLAEAYHGEAICRETPLISGLYPDYYSCGPDPPYEYDYSLEMAKQELMLANVSGIPTFNVWEEGFYLIISYNTGNDQRMIACNMIRDFFTELSTYDGRTGPPFQIDIAETDWPTYLGLWFTFQLPIWAVGWLSDYADADNWMGAYMHSWICFAYFQVYRIDNGYGTPGPDTGLDKDELIGLALKTPDGPARAALYKDLENLWQIDAPALTVAEPLGRAWRKYWVKGWYYNGLYPAIYYYKLYKEDTCYSDVTGPTFGVPDGVDNMRDINFIAAHFGASPPDVLLGYNALWAPGTYGYAGCDVYGDRKVDMRDIGLACAHFGHTAEP